MMASNQSFGKRARRLSRISVCTEPTVTRYQLSRLEASNDKDAFGETVRGTMHASLFFVLPMMAGVMALSYGLIDLIYGGGEFVGKDISVTAAALLWMAKQVGAGVGLGWADQP